MYILGFTEDQHFSFQIVFISHPFSRRRLESIETSQPSLTLSSGNCLNLLRLQLKGSEDL